ncbi:MAG: AAA family ATPase, partial [Thermomonas sp.]|nr:AAA family ATPase [Thermomonas sp.]
MYLSYYGLHEPPFSITPDPRFVHLSERHRDALAHLLFGIDKGGGGGFVQLTGEVGTGKTTLSRLLLERLPRDARVALVLNPRQNAVELLETICEELHINIDGKRGSTKALVDILNAHLLVAYSKGLRVVLLIDEAQNLPADALEQVRLLTNLETDTQKLLQILLLGQPELRDMVARPELRQLAQRITARYHLTPLDAKETGEYLRHRWRVAGGQKFPFDAKAVQRMHQRSGGVPRLLNVIAERALLAGYARDATVIDARLVDAAANEVLQPAARQPWWPWLATAAGLAAIALLAMQWRDRPLPTIEAGNTVAAASTNAPQPATTPAATRVDVLDAAGLTQLIGATGDTPVPAWQHLLRLWALP